MMQEFEKIRVLISYNGLVHWEPGGVFATTCDIDITYFPFDKQVTDLFDDFFQTVWLICQTTLLSIDAVILAKSTQTHSRAVLPNVVGNIPVCYTGFRGSISL